MTKWGELIAGVIFVIISIPIFAVSVGMIETFSILGTGPPALAYLGVLVAIMFFIGGLVSMVHSHESPVAVEVRQTSPSLGGTYCRKCGSKLSPTQTWCFGCGTNVVAVGATSGTREVSSLGKTILISLPHGKTVEEISKETGVDESIVIEKVQNLKSGGFLTEGGKLTQEGYEEVERAGQQESGSTS